MIDFKVGTVTFQVFAVDQVLDSGLHESGVGHETGLELVDYLKRKQ